MFLATGGEGSATVGLSTDSTTRSPGCQVTGCRESWGRAPLFSGPSDVLSSPLSHLYLSHWLGPCESGRGRGLDGLASRCLWSQRQGVPPNGAVADGLEAVGPMPAGFQSSCLVKQPSGPANPWLSLLPARQQAAPQGPLQGTV